MPFTALPSPPALFPTYLVPSLPFRRRKSSTDSSISGPLRSLSIDTTSTSSGSPPNPIDAPVFLSGHGSRLRCARCAADLAHSSQIISKGFTGRHGRAYLVAAAATNSNASTDAELAVQEGGGTGTSKSALASAAARNAALPNLPNTYVHKPVPRTLVTGAHTVGDISCAHCGSVLGWKYVGAEEEAQRYKVGKFILEARRVCRSSSWDDYEGDEEVVGSLEGDEFVETDRNLRPSKGRTSSLAMPPVEMPAAKGLEEVEFDSQDEDEREDLFLGIWTPALATKRRKQKRFERIDED